MPRLFIGTFLSPNQQDKLGHLQDYGQRLESCWQRKIRWIKTKKLHLTWVFLGEQNQENIPELVALLSNTLRKKQAMSINYEQVEFWPTVRKLDYLYLHQMWCLMKLRNLVWNYEKYLVST